MRFAPVCIPGEVFVDNKLAYASLYPTIGERLWFDLTRRREDEPNQTSTMGPHIDLFVLKAETLLDLFRDNPHKIIKRSFSGTHLGQIEQYGPLAQVDEPTARLIVRVDLEAKCCDETLLLCISAKAGALPPHPQTINKPASQSLRITCTIPFIKISEVVEGPQGVLLQRLLTQGAKARSGVKRKTPRLG